ncbi:MAG: hypothetical protein DI598_19950, partial [Pseudopedobacter saltans]
MKLIDNILYIEGSEFIKTDKNPDGLIPKNNWDNIRKGKGFGKDISIIGRGGNGNEVLIEFESLPPVYQSLVQERLCNGADPYQYAAKQPLRDMVKPDPKARQFFENYELPNGDQLSDEYKLHWSNGAAILNAFAALLADKRKLKKDWNISIGDFWKLATELVKDAYIMRRFPHSLPSSERHLKPRFNAFVKD